MSKRARVLTTAGSISYEGLRCGRYQVEATRKRVPTSGGRPRPDGERLYGELVVTPGSQTDF